MISRSTFLATIAGGLALAGISAIPAAAQDGLTIFAAASLKNALDNVNAACEADVGSKATISYAASSALAKQIEEGAPADMFISADLDWMKYLADKKLTKPETEVKLLGNRIVLVAPKDSKAETTIAPNFDLAGLVGDGKLAMANVESVPAGKYGKAALEKLGVWDGVSAKVAQAENVRAALKLVSTGEAAAGIVYQTDASAEPGVKVVGTFPEDSHPPIIYPVGLTAAIEEPGCGGLRKVPADPEGEGTVREGRLYLPRAGGVELTHLRGRPYRLRAVLRHGSSDHLPLLSDLDHHAAAHLPGQDLVGQLGQFRHRLDAGHAGKSIGVEIVRQELPRRLRFAIGAMTESTPSSATPRRMCGSTVAGRSAPPARPQAATAPP